MEKDTLVKYAKELYQEAFDANSYFLIIQQYGKLQKCYQEEMEVSQAFYSIACEALQKACFMEIAKLYDKSQGTITIGSLLKKCQENISFFPEYRDKLTVKDEDKVYTIDIPYQHHLKPAEEKYFQDEVESQRAIFKAFDFPESESIPVSIDLTFPQFLALYQKRFCSLSKKQECIREQRNKIYAHNDEHSIYDVDAIINKNLITYGDIRELIDFALDCTGLILGTLTGIYHARQYKNIDDWEQTLILVQHGLRYQKQEEEKLREEFFS